MVKITAEIQKEMTISIEIIGKQYSETWYQERPGVFRTKGKGITAQMEDDGFGNDEMLEAIENTESSLNDVWENYLECN